MFPDNHTRGATDAKRAFFMGNALVVGIVERLASELSNRMEGFDGGLHGLHEEIAWETDECPHCGLEAPVERRWYVESYNQASMN